VNLAGENELLEVPPREVAGRRVRDVVDPADVELLDQRLGVLAQPAVVEHLPSAELAVPEVLHRRVVHHREVFRTAVAQTILGHERDAVLDEPPGLCAGEIDLVDDDPPRGEVTQAGDRLGEFLLSVAADAGDSDHLPRPHGEVDTGERLDPTLVLGPESPGPEDGLAHLDGFLVDLEQHFPPDHHLREVRPGDLRRLDGSDLRSLPENRHAVSYRAYLLELVCDENNRDPLPCELFE